MSLNDWKRVLVFGAHIDDEIVGPGGTIARLSKAGAQVWVVTFTGGAIDTGYSRVDLKGSIADLRRAAQPFLHGVAADGGRVKVIGHLVIVVRPAHIHLP